MTRVDTVGLCLYPVTQPVMGKAARRSVPASDVLRSIRFWLCMQLIIKKQIIFCENEEDHVCSIDLGPGYVKKHINLALLFLFHVSFEKNTIHKTLICEMCFFSNANKRTI